MALASVPSQAENSIDILLSSSDDDADSNNDTPMDIPHRGNDRLADKENVADEKTKLTEEIQASSEDKESRQSSDNKNPSGQSDDRKRKVPDDDVENQVTSASSVRTSEPLVTMIHDDSDEDIATPNGADSMPKRRRFLGHAEMSKVDRRSSESTIKQESNECTTEQFGSSSKSTAASAIKEEPTSKAGLQGPSGSSSTATDPGVHETPPNIRYLLFNEGDTEQLALLRVLAAESSRLPPFKMTSKEVERLPEALGYANLQTTFVNIRNFILSLWYENCHEELTLEFVKMRAQVHKIHVPLLGHIFKYLERAGYVNFGVFTSVPRSLSQKQRRKVIVIGAGVAGLSAARQLQHFGFDVVVLEGRERIGGRIATFEWGNYRAEMGAMVITGLGAGNPLHTLARQTNMKLHIIKNAHICPLYDHTGKLVTQSVDDALQDEFNTLLESTKKIGKLASQVDGLKDKRLSLGEAYDLAVKFAEQRHHQVRAKPLEQMEACLQRLNEVTKQLQTCRDKKEVYFTNIRTRVQFKTLSPETDTHAAVSTVPSAVSPPHDVGKQSSSSVTSAAVEAPPSTASDASILTQYVDHTSKDSTETSESFESSNVRRTVHMRQGTTTFIDNVNIDFLHELEEKLLLQQRELKAERRQLSATFPDQYWSAESKSILDWHVANLEFANATTIDNLSLEHWDQDDVHEFTGPHLTTKDGFSQLPNALSAGVDIRLRHVVSNICYNDSGVEVLCNLYDAQTEENSDKKSSTSATSTEQFSADAVVVTLPLGVLKENTVKFVPELPPWKTSVIARVGFGLLNKVILFFDKEFWTQHSDVWGYSSGPNGIPGEQYMFWSQLSATGQPSLLAINAGQAACASDVESDEDIIAKTIGVLRKIFGVDQVTTVLKSVVTRWEMDPFARGSYSYMSVQATGKDYDTLSLPITTTAGFSRVFFAGEHTIRDYPATVHGAFLSGIREAENIVSKFDPYL